MATPKDYFYLLSYDTKPNFLYRKSRAFVVKSSASKLTVASREIKKHFASVRWMVSPTIKLLHITANEAESYLSLKGFKPFSKDVRDLTKIEVR